MKGSDHCLSLNILGLGNTLIIPSSSKVTNEVKSIKPAPKSYAQIVESNATQSVLDKSWTEVTSGNQKQKSNLASPPKTEPEKRRVIFRKKLVCPRSYKPTSY